MFPTESMKMMKRREPSTKPWGTPWNRGAVEKDKLLSGGEVGFEPGEKDGVRKGCSEVIST